MSITSLVYNRTTREVAKARLEVRKYFGLDMDKYRGNGQVKLVYPFETDIVKKPVLDDNIEEKPEKTRLRRAVERLLLIRRSIGPVACCDMSTPAPELYFNFLHFLFSSRSTRIGVAAHEITHSFQSYVQPRIRQFTTENTFLAVYSKHCAMEGLAKLAEIEIRKNIPKGLIQGLVEKLYRIIKIPLIYLVRPEILIKKIATGIIIRLNDHNKERIAEKIDSNPRLARLVYFYSSGLKFAGEIAKKLGPEVAFRLICEKPPVDMKELLFPERYLEGVNDSIAKAREKATKELDSFHQRTGIAL